MFANTSTLALEEYDVIVIGAGFSGVFTALELAKDHSVLLIDRGNEIIGNQSSSLNECYKLHTGLHYAGDITTARQCLENSIAFAKEYRPYILGKEGDPWRRGRHYIMSDSLVSPAKVKKVARELQTFYAKKVSEDPNNKVFGDPKDFFKILSPDKYRYVSASIPSPLGESSSETTQVALAIETPESQIDIRQFKAFLQEQVSANPRITFLSQHEVTRVAYSPSCLGYIIEAKQGTSPDRVTIQIKTKAVVNCAWQNVEKLDRQLGFYTEPIENRIIRIKLSVHAKLPQSLINMNTCIFSIGPYCSITNLGDGTAIVTYEPVTNAGHFFAGTHCTDSRLRELTSTSLDHRTGSGQTLASDIMAGAAGYVPDLVKATVLQIRTGYVKTLKHLHETYSITAADSPIHRRLENGVEAHGRDLCYISHSGMKMTYTPQSARQIREILGRQFTFRLLFDQDIQFLAFSLTPLLAEIKIPGMDILLYQTFRKLLLSASGCDPVYLTLSDHKETLKVPAIKIQTNVNHKSELNRGLCVFFSSPEDDTEDESKDEAAIDSTSYVKRLVATKKLRAARIN